MAGGRNESGKFHGRVDDYGYNIADSDGILIQLRTMKLLGFDHRKLFYKHQGRRFHPNDVNGHVVEELVVRRGLSPIDYQE